MGRKEFRKLHIREIRDAYRKLLAVQCSCRFGSKEYDRAAYLIDEMQNAMDHCFGPKSKVRIVFDAFQNRLEPDFDEDDDLMDIMDDIEDCMDNLTSSYEECCCA